MNDRYSCAAGQVARRAALAGGALLGFLLMGTATEESAAVAAMGNSPGGPMVPAASARVEIKDYEYLPATLTVPSGTTVTWTSHDDEPHTVTSSEKVFASPGLDADETFSYTFATPGTYTYYCTLHPHMTGTITVK
jgi:plastocyanin